MSKLQYRILLASYNDGYAYILKHFKKRLKSIKKQVDFSDNFKDIALQAGNIEAAKYFKFQAFTTAVVQDHKVRARIKAALAGAIKRGESSRTFYSNMQKTFDDFKLGSAKQLENVFATNTALAWGAGQQKAILEHQDTFPYWQYAAVMDSRTRDQHAALNGKVFKAEDHQFYPPLGFRCRCTAIPLTQEEAKGLIQQDPSITKTPDASTLQNAEFAGNKQLNFIKWLKNEYPILEEPSKIFIEKAIQELTSSANKNIAEHRKQIREYAKNTIVGKSFTTTDGKTISLSNKDIKDVLNQPHDNIFEKNNLLTKLDNVFKNAVFIKSAPELKGRNQYKKWFYYKYKEKFYLNIVENGQGNFRIHSISDHLK